MASAGTANGALATALAADVIADNLALIESDLSFLFENHKVHRKVQAKIAREGYTELALFAKADAGGGVNGRARLHQG